MSAIEDGQPRAITDRELYPPLLKIGSDSRGDFLGWKNCNSSGDFVRITDDRLVTAASDASEIGGTEAGCWEAANDELLWFSEFFVTDPRWSLSGEELILSSNDTIVKLESYNGPAEF